MLKLQTFSRLKIGTTTIIRNHLANKTLLLGKSNYSLLPNKIVIRIPFYSTHSQTNPSTSVAGTATRLSRVSELSSLASALQSFISSNDQIQNQEISHLELRFIPIQYPYLDSYILNQYIAINTSKYNFNRIQKLLFNKISSVNASDAKNVSSDAQGSNTSVSGLKMELSGRLTTQRSIPRKTVSSAQIGNFKGGSTMIKDTTSYASKNKIGAFTIKV